MLNVLLTSALAHVGLESPPPRYPSTGFSDNKACPCGVGLSNRICDIPTDRSDPDRGTDITTYAPGEVVTVSWHEVVGHAGRYRIAFDPDGADLDDFNANILLDIADPAGNAGNTGIGDLWEVQVTLPVVPCDNCTLQLIQMMDGNTVDPVPDPVGRSSYYQCADIVIADVGDTGDTGRSDTADTAVGTADTSLRATGSSGDTGDRGAFTTGDTGGMVGGAATADTGTADTGSPPSTVDTGSPTSTGDTATSAGDTAATSPGDTAATSPGDTAPTSPGDTAMATTPDTGSPADGGTAEAEATSGCGCDQRGAGGWALLPGLLLFLRRR